jgi:hypothetical protein
MSPKGEICFLPDTLPESLSARQKPNAVRIHAPNEFIVELERPHGPQDIQELVSMVAAL